MIFISGPGWILKYRNVQKRLEEVPFCLVPLFYSSSIFIVETGHITNTLLISSCTIKSWFKRCWF